MENLETDVLAFVGFGLAKATSQGEGCESSDQPIEHVRMKPSPLLVLYRHIFRRQTINVVGKAQPRSLRIIAGSGNRSSLLLACPGAKSSDLFFI